MRQDQCFGIITDSSSRKLTDRHDWLYCQCVKHEGSKLQGYVINGDWYFDLDLSTGDAVIKTPWGPNPASGWKIAFAGPFPKERCRDYNDAIAYMEEMTNHGMFILWWNNQRYWWHEQWERFARACAAFKQSWTGKKTEDDYDDEIPF